ncbi:FecR family protein [Pedobacter nutrimenti]|uniref:FecR family protein n=1 Tax=Pedobacter nutrimenti TaxID=1241337 RepID=UPI00292D5FA4|nr:FecR domain-containing protein [Pedobacter nutrimenti]
MTKQEYIVLYEKFCTGKCTSEEEILLDKYSKDFLIDDPWVGDMGNENEVEARITNQINYSINKVKNRNLQTWLTAAAAIILLTVGALLFYNLDQGDKKSQYSIVKHQGIKGDIEPGGTKAVLTLATGQKIILDSAKNGLIVTQGNTKVVKLANGELAYRSSNSDNLTITNNTMSTPRGGRYDLILSDGTKVFLNAASSITYPTRFSGNQRKVKITGEAYFEVSKNPKMPFVVIANGTETQVLGTHFNIMAYDDEPSIKTTLLEGAVKFKKANSEVILKPGQQAVLTGLSNNITVQNANLEQTMAWKNGYFTFQDEDIQTIMRKVARWYDVEIIYEPNLKKTSFGGSVSRYKNVSDLLKVLQTTGTIHFKIDERRIIVMN